MQPVNSDDNLNHDSQMGEPEINELEDTKPRRVTPVEEQPAADATRPVLVSDDTPHVADEDAWDSVTRAVPVTPDTEADLAATRATPTAAAFDDTMPPPPGLDAPDLSAPASAAAPVLTDTAAAADAPVSSDAAAARALPAAAAGQPPRPPRPKAKPAARRGLPWAVWPVLGLIVILLIALGSAAGGYVSGIGLRQDTERTQVALSVMDQYQLGLQNMAELNFYRARQHFEYVIRHDPSFPGAAEKLAETIMYLESTATPTVAPTPTLTPTPDTRAIEDLYNQAQTAISNKEWDAAAEALLALRNQDMNYRTVEVDGLLFLVLRQRGAQQIAQTDLEGGIYSLTLAEKFAPLDTEAQALLSWSQMYITGASFWDIDWEQVLNYFSQVAPAMPNLMDSSRMTSTERYRIALFEYGNLLARQGQACKALNYYQQSLAMGQAADVQAAFDATAPACQQVAPSEEAPPPAAGP